MTFVPLVDAADSSLYGGKAAGLAAAVRAGHRVPDGVVLRVGAPTPELAELNATLQHLGGVVAVRSSGIEEDGAEASFAGQYETVLGVATAEELRAAITRCRGSAHSQAAREYGDHFHRDGSSIAVLVQHMLEPEVAGVAFGIDPVTGAEEVVIEAVEGLGDALLSGTVDGERWVVRAQPTLEHGRGSLGRAHASEIASLCTQFAATSGSPVDIEWAIAEGTVHILQVRPVTAPPIAPTQRPPETLTYVREPRFDRPLHPLSFSAWLPVHGRVVSELFAEFGIPAKGLDNRHYLGRVYGRLVPLVGPAKDGPTPPKALLRLLMTVVPTMRRRLRAGLSWAEDRPIHALMNEWDNDLRARDTTTTRALRSHDLAAMSSAQLDDHLDAVLDHVEATAMHHFRLAFATQLIATGRLGIFLEDHLGWTADRVIGLLQGHGASSTAHGRAINALAESLGAEGVDRAIADPEWLLTRPEVREYLQQHGHRVNTDLTLPTESENPALLADHLRRRRSAPHRATNPRLHAETLEAAAISELGAPEAIATFHRLLDLARRGRPYNDDSEAVVLDALTLLRPIALEAGNRLAEVGTLSDRDDVFFLEVEELRSLLRGHGTCPDVQQRKGEHRWALANPAPSHFGPEPGLPPHWTAIPRPFQSTVGAVMWATAAEVGAPVHSGEEGVLVGTPGSPGTVTGTVRVVRSMADFPKVNAGDIVVCPTSVGAWSPIFGTIGGLVTEHGGPLSHPATLAREYGLPAVLSVSDATRRLRDGDRVEIDGGAGTIKPQ